MPLRHLGSAPRRAHSHQTGSGASGSDRGEDWDPGNRVECGGIAETPRQLVDDVVLPNSRAVYPGWSRFAKSRGQVLFVLSLIISAALCEVVVSSR